MASRRYSPNFLPSNADFDYVERQQALIEYLRKAVLDLMLIRRLMRNIHNDVDEATRETVLAKVRLLNRALTQEGHPPIEEDHPIGSYSRWVNIRRYALEDQLNHYLDNLRLEDIV